MNSKQLTIPSINRPLLIIALLICLLHGMVYGLINWHSVISEDIKPSELAVEFITLSTSSVSLNQLGVGKVVGHSAPHVIEKVLLEKVIKINKLTKLHLSNKSKNSEVIKVQNKGRALLKANIADATSIDNTQLTTSSMKAPANIAPITKLTKNQSPKAHNNVKPPYPLGAFHLKQEGEVIIQVEVLANGHSGKVNVFRTSGHVSLDEAATEAVEEWTFDPALEDGMPVDQWVRIPITFSLLNK